jgi:integrase
MAKKKWPRIATVTKNGKTMIMVDARHNGRGTRRFFSSATKAEGWAQQQRITRKNEGLEGVRVPERLRVEAAEAAARLKPHGATITDAVNFFLKHAKPAGGQKKLCDLVGEFVAAKRAAGRREEYLRIQSSVLGLLVKALPDLHAHEVTSTHVTEWLDSRAKTLRTRSNYQNDVRNLFGYAIKHGFASRNPVDQMEPITLDDKAVEILTPEQAGLLLNAAVSKGGSMVPFVAIGLFAGLRTREIAVLDWKDVSLAEKTIVVLAAKTKTRARRTVELPENLVSWLTPYAQKSGPVTPEKYRSRFEEVRKAAGVTPWPRNAMRHSAASYHYALHKNESLTQAMLGHESGDMLIKNYKEIVKPSAAVAYFKIMPGEAKNVISITEAAA